MEKIELHTALYWSIGKMIAEKQKVLQLVRLLPESALIPDKVQQLVRQSGAPERDSNLLIVQQVVAINEINRLSDLSE